MLFDAPDPPLQASLQISEAAVDHGDGTTAERSSSAAGLRVPPAVAAPQRFARPMRRLCPAVPTCQRHAAGELLRLLGRGDGFVVPSRQRVGDRENHTGKKKVGSSSMACCELRDRRLELPGGVKADTHQRVVDRIERIEIQRPPHLGQGLLHATQRLEAPTRVVVVDSRGRGIQLQGAATFAFGSGPIELAAAEDGSQNTVGFGNRVVESDGPRAPPTWPGGMSSRGSANPQRRATGRFSASTKCAGAKFGVERDRLLTIPSAPPRRPSCVSF